MFWFWEAGGTAKTGVERTPRLKKVAKRTAIIEVKRFLILANILFRYGYLLNYSIVR